MIIDSDAWIWKPALWLKLYLFMSKIHTLSSSVHWIVYLTLMYFCSKRTKLSWVCSTLLLSVRSIMSELKKMTRLNNTNSVGSWIKKLCQNWWILNSKIKVRQDVWSWKDQFLQHAINCTVSKSTSLTGFTRLEMKYFDDLQWNIFVVRDNRAMIQSVISSSSDINQHSLRWTNNK